MRVYWHFRNISLLLGVFCYFSCVGQEIICKDNTKLSIDKEAIVILPGFGDSKKGRNEQEKFFKEKGYDLFIPEYMNKFKVDNCVENLHEFYDKNQLKDYKKMSKYLVETYYTCTFKVNHYLDDINETELKNLEKRDDGKFEVLDVKLDNRKTKSLDPVSYTHLTLPTI